MFQCLFHFVFSLCPVVVPDAKHKHKSVFMEQEDEVDLSFLKDTGAVLLLCCV
jgi:hypothetical protein